MPSVIIVPRPEKSEPKKSEPENAVYDSGDLLEGAAAIAIFLYGEGTHARRARTAIRQGLPVFRLGNRLLARRSVISAWVADQERRAAR